MVNFGQYKKNGKIKKKDKIGHFVKAKAFEPIKNR